MKSLSRLCLCSWNRIGYIIHLSQIESSFTIGPGNTEIVELLMFQENNIDTWKTEKKNRPIEFPFVSNYRLFCHVFLRMIFHSFNFKQNTACWLLHFWITVFSFSADRSSIYQSSEQPNIYRCNFEYFSIKFRY